MPRSDSIAERLAFLELSEADRRALSKLAPELEKRADAFVAEFYRHLLAFEPTRELLSDPRIKTRLLGKQREYLLSLGAPRLDADYFAERIAIGRKHVDVGLEPRWYLGGYMVYLKLLVPMINQVVRDPAEAQQVTLALLKLVMLDAQLAMEEYIAVREGQLEYLNRELAEASRLLGQRLDEQSDELREVSARAQAAEQLAALATIIAGLAHEIGTPMSVIQGHAELLESSVTDDRGRKRLNTIREQIERISHIIQTLLNMARPSSSEHTPVLLGRLIDDTLAFLQEKFRGRGIRARSEIRVHASVMGSAERLQQLLLNLFLNAADAMPDGGELQVILARAERDARTVELRVIDSGHGIPAEILERIFEPFFTTKAAGRGSGLGLMVAKGIAVDHGGTISARSEVGRGTEILVRLPCKNLRKLA